MPVGRAGVSGLQILDLLQRVLLVATQVRGERLDRQQRRRGVRPHLVEHQPVLLLLNVGAVHEELGFNIGVLGAGVRADRLGDGLLVAAEVEEVLQPEKLVIRHVARRDAAKGEGAAQTRSRQAWMGTVARLGVRGSRLARTARWLTVVGPAGVFSAQSCLSALI